MSSNPHESSAVSFGAYQLDLRSGELFKGGFRIRLQQQPFQVLSILLEKPGEVVAREELQKRIWTADTFVDFEHGLNTAIKKLRQALNDDAERPRFIETLPRRGYRFIAEVQGAPGISRAAAAGSGSDLVGQVLAIRGASGSNFILVPVDEEGMKELGRLRAASDDLGISLLAAEKKLLVIAARTQVRVLEGRQAGALYEVRILDGEHIGLTAVVPREALYPPS
ncbi:MAG: winged helix-turn-helix domain-containing protein [Candidatus Acidiferrales bacterium]